jgi:membrane fusion protein (multidrug efflux system)
MWQKVRKPLISLVVLACACFVVISVSRIPNRTEAVPPKEEILTNVEVLSVETLPRMSDVLELPGTLEPNLIVEVPVEQRGSIEEVLSQEGQRIEKGGVLARLDDSLLRAEYERIKAQADFDRRTYERSAALLEKGVLNKSQVEEVEARADVSAAALKVAKTNLDRTTVYSPVSGVLNDLLKEVGEFVSSGDGIAQIVDVDTLKVIVQIPERDIRYLRPNSQIDISVDPLSDKIVRGAVTYISEVADAVTRTTRAEISVDNKSGSLHSGMIVRARIPRRVLKDAILIPLAAVIPLEEGRVVYVVSGNRAEKRDVELGIIRDSRVQITKGLQPGDLVIVSGHRQVGPGQKVNVVQTG